VKGEYGMKTKKGKLKKIFGEELAPTSLRPLGT
jgi:hypothetical protein